MGSWPGPISAVTLFVEDLGVSKAFYQDVLGLPLKFEDTDSAVFDCGNTLINLLVTAAAPELIAPAVVGGPEAGARAQFTIDVDDVDATFTELRRRGVTFLNGPIDRPWGVRTACFADPAGHIWEVAH